MNQVIDHPYRDRVKEEAAAWVARLDAGRLSPEELPQLREWVSQSEEHKASLEEMARIWDNLDVLDVLDDCDELVEQVAQTAPRRPWLPAALAAGLAVIALGIWSTADRSEQVIEPASTAVYATEIGEQQTVSLPDGSNVELNTASRLEVRFSEETRWVDLHLGEAFFDVTHEPGRPFVVKTSHGLVTAVGTAFSVRVENNNIKVTVKEGRVKVASQVADPVNAQKEFPEFAMLNAGQSIVYDDKLKTIENHDESAIARRLAWRDGMLIFNGDALESVVTEVSRYAPVEIVISDPNLRELRIGGYFRTGEIDSLLNTLELNFGIEIEHVNDQLIYLYAAK